MTLPGFVGLDNRNPHVRNLYPIITPGFVGLESHPASWEFRYHQALGVCWCHSRHSTHEAITLNQLLLFVRSLRMEGGTV